MVKYLNVIFRVKTHFLESANLLDCSVYTFCCWSSP